MDFAERERALLFAKKEGKVYNKETDVLGFIGKPEIQEQYCPNKTEIVIDYQQ